MTLEQLRGSYRDYPVKLMDGEGGGGGGLPCLEVRGKLADARIYLYGAHITHFQPRGQKPVLFLSRESHFHPGKPIRGGVPVCWPWFGAKAGNPNAPSHGFARLQTWEVTSIATLPGEQIEIILQLLPGDLARALGYKHFELEMRVVVGTTLTMTLTSRNTGTSPLLINEALHSYFQVGDITRTTLTGLQGATYMDKTQAMQRFTQKEAALTFAGETDRHFINTAAETVIHDPAMGRRIVIGKGVSDTTVVWNPWVDKAEAMADFGDEEWKTMLCVETANAADNAITLQPGQSHAMQAIIRVEAL